MRQIWMCVNKYLAVALVALCAGEPVRAAEREIIRTDWGGFQREVTTLKLGDRQVRIELNAGEVKTKLVRVAGDEIIVRANKSTRQWPQTGKEAAIPADQVRSVQFFGHLGHRGAI